MRKNGSEAPNLGVKYTLSFQESWLYQLKSELVIFQFLFFDKFAKISSFFVVNMGCFVYICVCVLGGGVEMIFANGCNLTKGYLLKKEW